MTKHTRTLAIERNERRAAEGQELKPVPDDGPWSPSTVLGILRNPRHAGYSVYTDRTQRAAGDKRKQWYTQILRDENGTPVKGQWEPLVDEVTWLAVQDRLNDQSRVTNRTGSTKRKHLGSSLYKCGICDQPITAHSRGYRCDGHVTRSRPHVDDFVVSVVKERLSRDDLRDLIPARDEPRLAAIKLQITEHEGNIARAQSDYDNQFIEGFDLKRIRDRERDCIADLEVERRSLAIDTELEELLGSRDPVKAFEDAPLSIQRKIIDFFMEVRLLHHPQGRKGFDPATVKITPKHLVAN